MTQSRFISHRELRDEMMAVARGEKPAPVHAGTQTFESVEALMRLLTPENRRLLAGWSWYEARGAGLPGIVAPGRHGLHRSFIVPGMVSAGASGVLQVGS